MKAVKPPTVDSGPPTPPAPVAPPAPVKDPARRHGFRRPRSDVKDPRNDPSNGKLIRGLMKAGKQRGNPRDYVVLVGSQMMEFVASYTVVFTEDSAYEPSEGMTLVHKRNLYRFIGDGQAARFWNRKLGIRVPQRREVKS